MQVNDIIRVIEEFAPLSVQEKWDNSGLCIGSGSAQVTSVLLGLDCTPELVDEAVSCGADMIVTHHPLIFSGLKRICPDDPVGAAVMRAVSAGIAVYAAHTSADKVIAGVSGAMAARLGLENVRVLDPEGEGIGLGVVGEFPRPLTAQEAVALVKEKFSLKTVIGKAMESGARLYITGDVSYHRFFTPEGFMLMDIGHYESEIDILQILFSLIRKNFPTFAVRITENLYSNPIHYL